MGEKSKVRENTVHDILVYGLIPTDATMYISVRIPVQSRNVRVGRYPCQGTGGAYSVSGTGTVESIDDVPPSRWALIQKAVFDGYII